MNQALTLPEPAKARGRVAPAQLAHIVFKTPRFKAMVNWWCTVLEAKPAMANDDLAFLTYDEEHHRVAIVNMPALLPRPGFMRGLDHVAFTYASLSDLLATWERLKELGIEPVWCTNHGPTTSLYYADPDGNKAELQIDNFDTPEDVLAWAANSDFASNPIGVDFDPADLNRRLEAGEPEASLKERPVIGPRGLASVPRSITGSVHKLLARLAGR
ncbi:MAG: VOC family protein [Pseudomonadota bacterium]